MTYNRIHKQSSKNFDKNIRNRNAVWNIQNTTYKKEEKTTFLDLNFF